MPLLLGRMKRAISFMESQTLISTARTEPLNVIAFIMAMPLVLPDPGGPIIAILHSESDGIVISLPLSVPNTIPLVFFQRLTGRRGYCGDPFLYEGKSKARYADRYGRRV